MRRREKQSLMNLLGEIEELTKLGLGSATASHWEAALEDILATIRKAGKEQSP